MKYQLFFIFSIAAMMALASPTTPQGATSVLATHATASTQIASQALSETSDTNSEEVDTLTWWQRYKKNYLLNAKELSSYGQDPSMSIGIPPNRTIKKGFKPHFELHMMADFGYAYNSHPKPNEAESAFFVERSAIYAMGYLTPTVDIFGLYYVYPSSIRTIHEMFARWRPMKELNFRVGRFKTPVTYENNVGSFVLHTIEYSQAVSTMVMGLQTGTEMQVASGRDLGVEVFGDLFNDNGYGLVKYRLGLFNGNGIFSARDNNNTKDVGASLTLQPQKGYFLGGGVYYGQGNYQQHGETVVRDHDRNRWWAGFIVDNKYVYLRGDYLRGVDGGYDRQGFYALGSFKATNYLDFTIVYDWYQNDMTEFGGEMIGTSFRSPTFDPENPMGISTKYSVGATYRFTRGVRAQAFYTHTNVNNLSHQNKFTLQLEISF